MSDKLKDGSGGEGDADNDRSLAETSTIQKEELKVWTSYSHEDGRRNVDRMAAVPTKQGYLGHIATIRVQAVHPLLL